MAASQRISLALLAIMRPVAGSLNRAAVLNITAFESGRISVFLNGRPWLDTSQTEPWIRTGVRTHTLKLLQSEAIKGVGGNLGNYTGRAWDWLCPDAEGSVSVKQEICLRSELRQYEGWQNSAEIVQTFPVGVQSIHSAPWEGLASGWPLFDDVSGGEGDARTSELTWHTFNGFFAVDVDHGRGLTCKVGTQGGSPLILHDEDAARHRDDSSKPATLIISPLSRAKVGQLQCQHGSLALGVKQTLTSIPVGFSASWVIHAGSGGVTETAVDWGSILLKQGGKQRVSPYEDEVTSSLGYWTDNGAFFHYPTKGPTLRAGGYWEEILRANANFTNGSAKLPFRHWQLDSWWYEKGKGGNGSSRGSGPIGPFIGAYRWEADPFVFPPAQGGLPGVQASIKLPFVLHNRWFAPGNWYEKQGVPSTGWTNSSGTDPASLLGTLPHDNFAFFDYFFDRAKKLGFGLHTYEQDFLWTQYELVPALRRNATFADDWLAGMGKAAEKHGIAVQYCMPYPRDYLASAWNRNVRTIRATNDYKPNDGKNWRIARQSLLAHAVGLLPFKDTFLSNSAWPQDGAANPGPELSADLHAIVSVLSASMVAPGDGPGFANRTRLMATCREDGRLLKPDRPAYPVDAAWSLDRDPGGELSWTVSRIASEQEGDHHEFRYVLAAELARDYDLTKDDIGLGMSQAQHFVARNWFSHEIRAFSSEVPLRLAAGAFKNSTTCEGCALASTARAVDYEYWAIAEVLPSGWALLGEVGKYVPVSADRFSMVRSDSKDALEVRLAGVSGEVVEVCALDLAATSPSSDVTCKSATLAHDGTASLLFSRVGRRPGGELYV